MEKERILVVDDKEINRFVVCEIFRDRYKFYEAEDGLEAIECLKKHKDEIAIVMLDIIMPNLDGFGVLDYMKKEKLFDKIPVVMITSDASAETEKRLEMYDVAEVVRKPFIPAIMNRRVKNILNLYDNKSRHDEEYQREIIRLQCLIEENEKKYILDIDESVYLVKSMYNILKKHNVLDDEMNEDIKTYLNTFNKR